MKTGEIILHVQPSVESNSIPVTMFWGSWTQLSEPDPGTVVPPPLHGLENDEPAVSSKAMISQAVANWASAARARIVFIENNIVIGR